MNAIAYIHLLDGDLNAAEKKLIKSLGLAPANQEALMLMANIQRRRGQFDAEIALLKEALVNTGGQRPAMLLARRYRESGNFKQALELYDRVMTSRDVAKRIKLTAAMQAGMFSSFEPPI